MIPHAGRFTPYVGYVDQTLLHASYSDRLNSVGIVVAFTLSQETVCGRLRVTIRTHSLTSDLNGKTFTITNTRIVDTKNGPRFIGDIELDGESRSLASRFKAHPSNRIGYSQSPANGSLD